MNEEQIACMPLVENIQNPESKSWTKTICPRCGRACWETDTYKWAKALGIIKLSSCTECALKTMQQEEMV